MFVVLCKVKDSWYGFFFPGPTDDVFCSNQFHNELEWTVVVAQHILCKLSGKKCIIDHHYPNKDVLIPDGGIDYVCPCDQHGHMPGKFGDTSFGKYICIHSIFRGCHFFLKLLVLHEKCLICSL